MLVSLWNYLKGYVIVEVSGYALDRFMNMVVTSGIQLEEVRRVEDKLYMQTTIKDFKRLKPYAKKTKCRLKITKKEGMPFISFRYRRRLGFVIGSLLFAVGIYALCSFVWLIDIKGVARLNETEVIEYLSEEGYKTGCMKSKLDLRMLEKTLMRKYPEIVWISAEYEGTKLTIQIAEAIPKPEIVATTEPCNLRAKKDALITYIATQEGIPQVKAGDTVRKGEVLVAGSTYLEDEQQSLYLAHAEADIKAKTCYSIVARIPLKKMQKNYTNQVARKYTVRLFDWEIPLYRSRKTFEYSDTLITIKQLKLTQQFPLPFYIQKEEVAAYMPYYVPYEEEEMKERLLSEAHQKLLESVGKQANVVKQEITYYQEEEHLSAVYNVIVEEDIIEKEMITQEMIEQMGIETKGVSE